MKNILIADDEKFVRLGIRTMIERSGLCTGEIIDCKNGQEALGKVREMNFDLILSDIKMPIMDGIEFCKVVKEENLTTAQLVIISGYDDFNYAVQAMRSGACEYLLKPIERESFTNLLEKVQKQIEAKSLEGVKDIENLENDADKSQKIQSAVEYIKNHYNENINMAVVSNEVSMNYTFFSETFKDITGKSFVDYLKSVRINMAKKLLRSTCVQVSRISVEVGFNDEKHFSKTFKIETGSTPSEYRKKYVNTY
ncbi:MAG: response regulator [Clostridia bacterium]